MYLSHGWMDGFLPHLPTRFILRLQQPRSTPSILLNTFYRIPMAYSSNSSFYSSSSTPSEFSMYPPLRRTSVAEEASIQDSNTFIHDRDVDGRPGHVVGSSRSLRPEASLGEYSYSFLDNLHLTRGSAESVSSDNSYAVPAQDYGEISFPRHYWPVIGQYAQPYRYGIPSRDNSSASTMASDVVLAPSSGKCLCYCETSRTLALINYEQSHLTAGGPTRVGNPPAHTR